MTEQAMDQTDDEGFTYDVCDSALEAAGGLDEKGPGQPRPPRTSIPMYC